jgi:hypothetical protein
MSDSQQLSTCSYAEYRPHMGNPVRITLGRPPRWWLDPIPSIGVLAPAGWYFRAAPDVFTEAYLAQLDRAGVTRIAGELWRVWGDYRTGRPLVLLCFESLAKHGWDGCHRTLFRTWWRTHTGVEIPELGSHPA